MNYWNQMLETPSGAQTVMCLTFSSPFAKFSGLRDRGVADSSYTRWQLSDGQLGLVNFRVKIIFKGAFVVDY
jgi:hypothetical protein